MTLLALILLSSDVIFRGYPLRMGTRGSTRKDLSGRSPSMARLDTSSQAEEATFATASAERSRCDSAGSPGLSADIVTVNSCTSAITGHTRKTGVGGVMSVGKKAAKAELVVGPTLRDRKAARVAGSGRAAGIMETIETKPK